MAFSSLTQTKLLSYPANGKSGLNNSRIRYFYESLRPLLEELVHSLSLD